MLRWFRLISVLTVVAFGRCAFAADAPVNYTDHVLPIFREKCGSCHSAGTAKGGLVLESYSAAMTGGASGAVVEAGDLDASRLWQLVTHQEQPAMPPSGEKLPDDQLKIIEKWISGGALESKESKPRIKKKASMTLNTSKVTGNKPEGPPPMPENLSTEPLSLSTRGNAITAMAASPWAPLLAIAGYQQVLLYDLTDFTLAGVLPFPEGTLHVLRFSRNGTLLLAGGGRGGQSGRVVVFDVRSGKRVFEIGAEPDVVLAADISPNHSLVALGGPKRMVRVFSTADGEQQYELKKHTDWVTAIEFSPDGVLLATADRSNGLMVWEANTGREFYALPGHTGSVTSVSWRADSNVLASSSEDSTIRLWEMNNGGQIKSWGAHGQGAASVCYLRDGRMISTGRDRVMKLFDQNGSQQRVFSAMPDLGLRVAYSETVGLSAVGDWTGTVKLFDSKTGEERASLVSNPPALQTRWQAAVRLQEASQQQVTQLKSQVADAQKAIDSRKVAALAAVKALQDAQAARSAAQAAKSAADQKLASSRDARRQAESSRNAAKSVRDQADAALKQVEKLKRQNALNAARASVDASRKLLEECEIAEKTALKEIADAERLVSETTALLPVVANLVNQKKDAADRAQREINPTPNQVKQLNELSAALTTSGKILESRRKAAEKLAREKSRARAG